MHLGSPPPESLPDADKVMTMATARLLGVYLGLQGFCETARLDPNRLLAAWCRWLLEPVQAFLDSGPFVLIDEEAEQVGPYQTAAFGVAVQTEQLLGLEWGERS
jgi:hypothetical protein